MLESYRKPFEELASSKIPDWKKINKNDLINSYIKYEYKDPELAQAYLGAIFCRYWNHIGSLYSKCYTSGVTKEECYSWLVDGVTFCLKDRIWLNPNNKLYGDPNGPDKAMNIDISTYKLIFYQTSNYDCRRVNYGTVNIDKLLSKVESEVSNSTNNNKSINWVYKLISCKEKDYDYIDSSIKDLIINSFNKGDYFLAFMVDMICHYRDVFIVTKTKHSYKEEFSQKKLTKYIRCLDEKYALNFAFRFNINKDRVVKVVKENMNSLSSGKVRDNIKASLNLLKFKVEQGELC